VLDFEATCEENDRTFEHEIIEFPVVLLARKSIDDAYTEIGRFESFVRPTKRPTLSRFCTQLTTIEQSMVDSAPVLADVLRACVDYIEVKLTEHELSWRDVLPVTCGDWDLLTCLRKECMRKQLRVPPCFTYWCNLKHVFARVGLGKARGTHTMLESLGMQFEGTPHRGIDDTRQYVRFIHALVERYRATFGVTEFHSVELQQRIAARRIELQKQRMH
jgi:inhibitor of KinA sporulation pathway (predicted exonuclease)